MLRRRCQYRALRKMAVLRQVHDHAPAADARGDAVDQGRQFVIVMHIGIEIALLLHDDFRATGGQADEVESETGIERIVQGIEPLAKQAVDHLAFGHGLSGVHNNCANRAIGAKKLASSRRAPLPCCAIATTSICASRDNVVDITPAVATGSAKTLLHDVIRQRLAWTDRRIALPQRPFQQGGKVSAESCRDFMTRARGDIADGFQPGTAQAGIYRSIGAQRGHRQRLDRISFLAVTDDATMDVTIIVRAHTEVPAMAALTAKP